MVSKNISKGSDRSKLDQEMHLNYLASMNVKNSRFNINMLYLNQSGKDIEKQSQDDEKLNEEDAYKIQRLETQKLRDFNLEMEKQDYRDPNIVCASWINSMGIQQAEMEHKRMFFINESILTDKKLGSHFSKKHISIFRKHHRQDFVCLRGTSGNGASPYSVNERFGSTELS
jgi:hypothetical protein